METHELKSKVQVWVLAGHPEAWEVLLLETRPDRGGFWQPVTGSVEPGETSSEGAARELFEETGIRVDPSALTDTGFEFEFESRWGGRVREKVWATRLHSLTQKASIRIDSREHVAFQWCDLRQAEKTLLHASAKKGLKMALKVLDKNF